MKSLYQLFNLVVLAILGGGLAAKFGADPSLAASGIVASAFGINAFKQSIGSVFMAATTDVDAIAKWAGKHAKQMINQVLNSLDVFKDLQVDRMVTRHGKLLPKFTAYAGIRPLDVEVEENGRSERKFSGRKLFVYDVMKLFKIVPEEEGLLDSFLSDMIAPGAKDIPFAQWVWGREMEKLAEEINDNFYLQENNRDAAAFSGAATYSSGDIVVFGSYNDYYKANASTSAGESPDTHPAKWDLVNHLVSFDGPAKIIADEITATNITPVVTGSITNANAVTKIELMYKAMTVAHRSKGGVVRVSPDVYQKYLEHEKTIYPQVLDQNMGDGKKYIYGSGKKWEIKETTWMGTSQRIIFDMQGRNLVVGTNLASTPGVTKSVETVHGYKSVAKWFMGFQIADLEVLYVNDQA